MSTDICTFSTKKDFPNFNVLKYVHANEITKPPLPTRELKVKTFSKKKIPEPVGS